MTVFAIRRLRIACGLVLIAYLTTHFTNHALGVISLDAMEAGREWFLLVWRNPVGTAALYGALLVHMSLGLWSLYRRRHLRMPAWEAAQLVLGLSIPPLLISHVVGTRLASEMFDALDSYERVVFRLWVLSHLGGMRQTILLGLAWIHGCMGIHFWLRLRSWYARVVPVLFALALLLPVFAFLGFAQAGRQVAAWAKTPAGAGAVERMSSALDPSERATLARVEAAMLGGFAAALGLVILARGGRALHCRRWGSFRVAYPGGHVVPAPVGTTLLEVSRLAGIPHASVCGGRGRCSTCRVRIVRGLDALPPAGDGELRVLKRVGAPPDVRLACQTRPRADVAVALVFPATVSAREALVHPGWRQGEEREIAVLFADLRGFTRVAEEKLPYDVVFILNRYFAAVGPAIVGAGGILNQFTGDGVMALFGVEQGPEAGCRQALRAARDMVDGVAALSGELHGEFEHPLRIGIGIHAGPAVVGRIGYGDTFYLTAVGDTVHVASRLEQATKDYGCELVISEEVAAHADLDVSFFPQQEIAVRNRSGRITVRVVEQVARLDAAVSTHLHIPKGGTKA